MPVAVRLDSEIDSTATLMNNPRSLHQLWQEYNSGIGNNKPAREFTRAERGRFKFKYSQQKHVWDLVSKLTNAGNAASVAIEKIYTAYGANKSVTNIINAIRKDAKNGTLPISLQV